MVKKTSLLCVLFLIGFSVVAHAGYKAYRAGEEGDPPQGDCLETVCPSGVCIEEDGTFVGHCCPNGNEGDLCYDAACPCSGEMTCMHRDGTTKCVCPNNTTSYTKPDGTIGCCNNETHYIRNNTCVPKCDPACDICHTCRMGTDGSYSCVLINESNTVACNQRCCPTDYTCDNFGNCQEPRCTLLFNKPKHKKNGSEQDQGTSKECCDVLVRDPERKGAGWYDTGYKKDEDDSYGCCSEDKVAGKYCCKNTEKVCFGKCCTNTQNCCGNKCCSKSCNLNGDGCCQSVSNFASHSEVQNGWNWYADEIFTVDSQNDMTLDISFVEIREYTTLKVCEVGGGNCVVNNPPLSSGSLAKATGQISLSKTLKAGKKYRIRVDLVNDCAGCHISATCQ